jgi:DnaJ-domain-containing protein 1
MNELVVLTLYLILGAGVAYALIAAGRELLNGVRIAKTEFAASQSASSSKFDESQGKEDPIPPQDEERASRPKNWYEVLEVSASANIAQIKAAYRKKIALYHPDKVAGLGSELRRLAEMRSKEINVAYAFACKLRDHAK